MDADRSAVRRDIVTTVAIVVALVLFAELAYRRVAPTLSVNSRSLAHAPDRAARIQAESARPTMLILGNSMSGEGIDVVTLRSELARNGLDAVVEHQPSDSSITSDWYYEFKNQYIEAGAIPDWLILPVGDARPLVRIQEPTQDLIFSFLKYADLPDFFKHAVIKDREDKAGFYLDKTVAMYGFRGRNQSKILTTLVPGFEDVWEFRRVTISNENENKNKNANAKPKAPRSTTAFIDLIDKLADKHGVRVVLLPVPTVALRGKLPASDRTLAEQRGWLVIEPAANASFTASDVPDGLHLTEAAKQRFTKLVAPSLAKLVAATPAAPQ